MIGPGSTNSIGWKDALKRAVAGRSELDEWAAANNVELAYVPFHASWLNRIEAQFTALR